MKKYAIIWGLLLAMNIMAQSVMIEYFYQVGCEECEKVTAFILPRLAEEYPGKYQLYHYDIGITENYLKLVELQEQLQVTTNDPVCMIINGHIYLGGFQNIERQLFSQLSSLSESPHKDRTVSTNSRVLERRAESFTIGTIIIAGLIDGFNPCVFATLVFFLVYLQFQKFLDENYFWSGVFIALRAFCHILL